ncbi:hypothetical protein CWC20_01620 [Pseudoalteromonas aurantia]|uniref:DUF4105 domain-containing protein n=1 Tax=Pseudoalteromonas aurantia TaxID=43654 RepID=A0ABY2W2K0_9GAMM|nr:hypothetical protein CWC20_01620 [Pseudoalteromonas aurantia]
MNFTHLFTAIFFLLLSITTKAYDLDALSHHEQWLRLLHYNTESDTFYIKSDGFYFSAGDVSARRELSLTIHNLSRNPNLQCKFPARTRWLKSQGIKLPKKPICNKFETWKKAESVDSVSLVFASGYMSNPASLYGHMLLKFNKSNTYGTHLLDHSINYGALVPEQENGVSYIVKGIFGGYSAGFSDQLFYTHHHNYASTELRDLWEYELSLSESETKFLLEHVWELIEQRFDYYFIDENCAYHIAKVIEVVTGKTLTHNLTPWVIPSTIFKKLSSARYQNHPLVREIKYTPSKSSEFHRSYTLLSEPLKELVGQLYTQPALFEDDKYELLTIEQKKHVLETLMSFVQLKITEQEGIEFHQSLKKKLINYRFKLPIGLTTPSNSIKPNVSAPHTAQNASKLSAGVLSSHDINAATLGFRLTYFDALNPDTARVKFSNLEMIDIELEVNNKSQLKVRKLDIIDLESFNPSYAETLPDGNWAWQLNVGFQRSYLDCHSCYFGGLSTGGGYSKRVKTSSIIYALANVEIGKNEHNWRVIPGIELGILSRVSDKMVFRSSVKSDFNSDPILNFEASFQLNDNNDLRLIFKQQNHNEVQLVFNYYWG